MRTQQDNERYFYNLIRTILRNKGKDFNTCELCKKTMKKSYLHHTKYDGATLNDILIVCQSCNTKKENIKLI